MTTAQKSKAISWLEIIPKAITPGLLIAIIWHGAKFQQKSEDRQFPDVETRVETVEHVRSSPNEVDNYKAFQRLDTITKSVKAYNEVIIKQTEMDTLIKRNTFTIYQMKKQVQLNGGHTKRILEILEGN